MLVYPVLVYPVLILQLEHQTCRWMVVKMLRIDQCPLVKYGLEKQQYVRHYYRPGAG